MRLARIFRTTGFLLAALYAGLFGLSVLVLFAVIYWVTGDALRQQLAANIEVEVASLVDGHRSGGLARTAAAVEQRLASGRYPDSFYLLVDHTGRRLMGNLAPALLRDGWQELPRPRQRGDTGGDDRAEDGEHRVLALGAALADGSFLLVGKDTYRITEVKEAIYRAFGWAFGVTILLGMVGGGVLSLGFLRRVDAINQTSRAIIEGRLTDRVPTRGTDDELDRLAVNLNEMLDRVQSLMESLHQVSSDIAHDLRTPLSRLRQRLERARLKGGGVEDYAAAVDQAIADTDAILKTFAALLRIAQIESGSRKSAFATVDLSSLFGSILEAYTAVAEDRGQSLTASIDPGVHVRGDRELLTQMLANLVENAICHTPEGTRIAIALEQRPAGPVGIVADNGPGIPPEARQRVFERFFRLDRSRSSAGSGLGLSLVAAVADIHGISIGLDDNQPGLKVVLDFAPTESGQS